MVDETAIPGEFAERISVDSCRTTAIIVLGWLGGRYGNGHSFRNMAIMLLLLDSGLRVSELVGVDLEDLDLTEGLPSEVTHNKEVIKAYLGSEELDLYKEAIG